MSKNNDRESGFGAFLAGFIIGGLVGAAVALVLAPQSGEETRNQLAEQSAEWRNMVNENRTNWAENVNQMSQNATNAIGGIDLNSFTKKSSETIEDDETGS